MSTAESHEFNGLTMPVFNAFGFIQTDDIIEFALAQLRHFATDLHRNLPRELQQLFPYYGVDKETQGVYLARSKNISDDLHITFYAKPKSLRMAVNMIASNNIDAALKAINSDLGKWVATMISLTGAWEITAQQLELNEETGETFLAKELFKNEPKYLSTVVSNELIERMVYLQSDPKYTTGFVMTKNWPSLFVAGMGGKVGQQLASELVELSPVLLQLAGGFKYTPKVKPEKAKKAPVKREKATSAATMKENQIEQFTFHTTLKPLHIRKGFINMTPAHWPFFSKTARTEVREVTLRYDTHIDQNSAVWRIVPNDMARVVLGDKSARWLEATFDADDPIQISVIKNGDIIELELQQVEK